MRPLNATSSDHILRVHNDRTDYLSRNRLCSRKCHMPEVHGDPRNILLLFQNQMVVREMEDNVQSFIDQALAPSTLKSYKQDIEHFNQFCTLYLQ